MHDEDFTDEDSDIDLPTISALEKRSTVETIEGLHLFLREKFDENNLVNKRQEKKIKQYDKAMYGYKGPTGEDVKGLIDRVKELEEWKKVIERQEQKIRYMIAGIAFVSPFIFYLIKTLLSKMGIKL